MVGYRRMQSLMALFKTLLILHSNGLKDKIPLLPILEELPELTDKLQKV